MLAVIAVSLQLISLASLLLWTKAARRAVADGKLDRARALRLVTGGARLPIFGGVFGIGIVTWRGYMQLFNPNLVRALTQGQKIVVIAIGLACVLIGAVIYLRADKILRPSPSGDPVIR